MPPTLSSLSAAQPRPPVLAVVVPCYNEVEVLPETLKRLSALLQRLVDAGKIDGASCTWFVDDGSKDQTWSLIHEASQTGALRARGVKLSRNRGHQVALLAGLMTAKGDVLISVDADLQDDLEVIPAMLEQFASGHDIVYGVRNSRTTDSLFKRSTAEGYYKVLNSLGVEVVFNHADYRLMSRRAIEALRDFPESNVFLRGLIPQLGFPSSVVEYARTERFAGTSKYPLRKMLALAWQGVTSFSAAPLRAITFLGFAVSLASMFAGLWALGIRLFYSDAVPGWASIVIPLFLISGVQLLSLGIIGEYVAKIFMESKRRPHYFIEQLSVPVEVVQSAPPAAQVANPAQVRGQT
jgi:polyisoprenyl-phosphate glycosyltransferase